MRRSGPLFLFCFLLLVLSTLPAAASDSYEQDLSTALVSRILVLRNYYDSPHLLFDATGTLRTNSGTGFGPSEGQICITDVKLEPGKLTLTGVRPLEVFNPREHEWQVALTATKVSIEIDLPALEDPKTVVPKLLNTVFLKKAERAAATCSPEEQQRLLDDTIEHRGRKNQDTRPKLPDVASLDELHPYCVPGGDRAYQVGRGVKAPRAKYAPDPKYSKAAQSAKLQGTTVLLAIITPEGTPTAIAIQRSLAENLEGKLQLAGFELDQRAVEAVSQWKFDPATFQGKPVPVAINVAVNFKLY